MLESASGGASVFEAYRPTERALSNLGWFVSGGAANWGVNYLAGQFADIAPAPLSLPVSAVSAASAVVAGATSSVGAVAGGTVGMAFDRGLGAVERFLDPGGSFFRWRTDQVGYPEEPSAYLRAPGQPLLDLNKEIGYDAVNRLSRDWDGVTDSVGSAVDGLRPRPVDPDAIGLERPSTDQRSDLTPTDPAFEVASSDGAAQDDIVAAGLTEDVVVPTEGPSPTILAGEEPTDDGLAMA
jgi:hypothetical protein